MTSPKPVDLGAINLDGPGATAPKPASPAAPPSWSGQLPTGDLRCDNIDVRADQLAILSDVTARARPGRPLALTGPSGSGKSTLLAVLGGLLAPDAGTVTFQDHPVPAGDERIRKDIGLVLQGYGLVNLLTAGENVELAMRALGHDATTAASATAIALEQVGLTDRAEHLVEDLSGGEQQRVALARVFAAQPPALLADEPTAELDHDSRDHVMELLLDYAASGRILVIASHDPDVAAQCAERLTLHDGRVW